MKIKIIKSEKGWWYENLIGEILTVKDHRFGNLDYEVISGKHAKDKNEKKHLGIIWKTHCEIIEE